MINWIKKMLERIRMYPEVKKELIKETILKEEVEKKLKETEETLQNVQNKLNLLKKDLNLTSTVDDKNYWNDKWEKNQVWYSAPVSQQVIKYVKYREIPEITTIANQIISSIPNDSSGIDKCDGYILAVMKWLNKKFRDREFIYQSEDKEQWRTPEETLKLKYGDCDDFGILEYYIIREIFKIQGEWENVKHRLKCADGHVYYARGDIAMYAGRHFYLNWLHSSLEWMTVESTFYLDYSVRLFGVKPQKYNHTYGLINYTFNEEYSWSQRSLMLCKRDYKKV